MRGVESLVLNNRTKDSGAGTLRLRQGNDRWVVYLAELVGGLAELLVGLAELLVLGKGKGRLMRTEGCRTA